MGKIKFRIGSIVTTKDTLICGARFKITDIYDNNQLCNIIVVKKYKYPIQENDGSSKYADIGTVFEDEKIEEFIYPLKYILKKL